MHNVIFDFASDSFCIGHIIHIGPVIPIPAQKQSSTATHYFKVTTSLSAAYCRFTKEDAARRTRGALGAMLGAVKPYLFRAKGDTFDLSGIVSFGKIVELKNRSDGLTYGLPLQLNVRDEKAATIWTTFQTEESAQNVRDALRTALHSFYEDATAPSTEQDAADEAIAGDVVVCDQQ